MKRIFFVVVVLLLIIGAGGGWWYTHQPPGPHKDTAGTDDSNVRSIVTEFGTKLQTVSLTAPAAERKAAMNEAYSPYLTPELLAAWLPDGSDALGRQTASPWPDHIEITDSHPTGETYAVTGNVVEVASGIASSSTSTVTVATYPVTFELQFTSGHWLISQVTKGARSELPQVQTISGVWECLKQKDQTASSTPGCAYGIAALQSDGHFAVATSGMPTSTPVFKIGTKVQVTGLMTPANQLNSVPLYDIDGIISATKIEKI